MDELTILGLCATFPPPEDEPPPEGEPGVMPVPDNDNGEVEAEAA